MFMWNSAACSNAKEKVEPIQARYFEVEEYALSEDSPESLLLLEDRIVASYVEYSPEYDDAYDRWLSNVTGQVNQSGPVDSNGSPVYPGSRLNIYGFNGTLLKSLDLDETLAPTESRRILLENPSGGFCVFSTYIDFYSFDVTYQLAYFSNEGEFAKQVMLQPDEYIDVIQSICIAADGRICIAGWGVDYIDQVYVFSEQGRIEHSTKTEPVTLADLLLIDGQIYLHASVFREDQYREALFSVNSVSGRISEPTILPIEYPLESSVFVYGNTCCSYDRQKLAEYDPDTRSVRTILRWYDTEISISFVDSVRILPNQKIVCAGFSAVTGTYTVSMLTGTDRDPLANQKRIVVAGLDLNEDGNVQALVYRFNNSHKDYRIILRDYMSEIRSDLSWEQIIPELRRIILTDFFSGNAPDIYLDINSNMSLIDYSNKEDLLDLMPYLRGMNNITEENYLTDVVFGSQPEGNIYFVPASFSVNCLSGLPETIQGRKSWTIEEFNLMVSELPAGTPVQSDFTKTKLLHWALLYSMSEFVDYNRLRANFASESFISLLEWVNRYGLEEGSDVRNAALNFEYIDHIENVLQDYEQNGVVREYIGFPGSSSEGLGFFPRYIFAISSVSEYPDVCWDFISEALSEDFQNTHFPYEIPVSRKAVQARIDENRKEMQSSTIYPYTDADLTSAALVFWDIIERADYMFTLSDTVSVIVTEESAAYFAGQKTSEEVAKIIQNRVQNMLDERQ